MSTGYPGLETGETKMTLQQNIETLRTKLATVQGIDPEGKFYNETCKLLDRLDDAGLKQVHEANIKFVSKLAFNRMIKRGMVKTI